MGQKRHKPEEIVVNLRQDGRRISQSQLLDIVAEDEKARFTLFVDGRRIRAAHGHSIALDLERSPSVPPCTLYHGTARHNLDAIFAEGLHSRQRQLVRLSQDIETAKTVAARHGKPVVFTVDCAALIS